jgi:hypothetical protein
MFLVCFFEYCLVSQHFLHLGEQCRLFVVMVGFDELVPGEAVADKGGLVLVEDDRGLVIDGVVATED